MQSITAVTNKHTAKLHRVGSLYILAYDAWKLKHKKKLFVINIKAYQSYQQLTKFYPKLDLNFAAFVDEIVGDYQR